MTLPANNDAGIRPVITYGYDSLGRVTSVTNPLGRITSYTYDALDRVASVTLPAISTTTGSFVTTYSYDTFDAASNLVFARITDPNSIVTQRGYNEHGQLVKVLDGLSRPTATYTYIRGLIASITDAHSYTTSYAYDGGDRLQSTTFPDGTSELYSSTLDGLLTSVNRDGKRIDYGYDPYKRLVAEARYSGQERFTNTYLGQKLTQVEEQGPTGAVLETHTMLYDTLMRLTQVANPRGTVYYTYDAADRRTSQTVVGSPNVTTTYGYYNDGSVKTLTWTATSPSSVFTYLYDLAGRSTKLTFPQGQHRDFAYDEQGRLLSLSTKTSTNANIATYAHGYDLNYTTGNTWDRKGQRVSLNASVPSLSAYDGLHKYEYDAVYELTKDTYPNSTSVTWAYDAVGNRTSAGSLTYNYQKIGSNPNNWQRLISDSGGRSWTYDGRGNEATQTATGATFTYAFDWRNQLTAIAGSSTASYAYDPWGRRSSKTVSGTKTNYVYSGQDLVQEKNASLAVLADHLLGPGIDEPIAMKRGGSVYYYVVDGLGSVRLVTSTSNAVQNKYQWDAWGIRASTGADTVTNPFGYTAREIGDAQDHFYRARYYNPSLGRFLSEDPLRQDSTRANQFSYPSSPAALRDPLGLQGAPYPGLPPYTIPGGPYTWVPMPSNPRGGVYQGPNGNQVTLSPDGYWKHIPTQQRYDARGNPITPEQAHNPPPGRPRPRPIPRMGRPPKPGPRCGGWGILLIAIAEAYQDYAWQTYCEENPCVPECLPPFAGCS